jgi:hypothetical protein
MNLEINTGNGELTSLRDCLKEEIVRYARHTEIKLGNQIYLSNTKGDPVFCVPKAYYDNIINILSKIRRLQEDII